MSVSPIRPWALKGYVLFLLFFPCPSLVLVHNSVFGTCWIMKFQGQRSSASGGYRESWWWWSLNPHLNVPTNHLGTWLKANSNSEGHRRGLRAYTSNRLPGDAAAAGLQSRLWAPRLPESGSQTCWEVTKRGYRKAWEGKESVVFFSMNGKSSVEDGGVSP